MPAIHFAEIRPEAVEDLIERLINKHCLGMRVYYEWWPVMAQVLNEGPTGMVQSIIPLIQVSMGIKARELGKFFYEQTALDIVPIEAFAERGIMESLEKLRAQFALEGSLGNGQAQGPTMNLKDKPQL